MSGERRPTRTQLLVVAIAAVVVLVVGVLVGILDRQPAAASAVVKGTITSQAGKPLRGISVQVYRWRDHQWEALNAMDTGPGGRYYFNRLPAGRYTVAFEDDSGVGYLESWWGGGLTAGKARWKQVAPGAIVTMNDQVVLGAAITGHASLKDPDRGIIDATQFDIVAYPLKRDAGGAITGIRTTTQISSLSPTSGGYWRLQNLRTGWFVLQAVDNDEYPGVRGELGLQWLGAPASRPYSFTEWREAEVFRVVNGGVYFAPPVTYSFASAHPLPALVVKVVDPAGQPISHARLELLMTGPNEFDFISGVHGAPFSDAAGEIGVYRPMPGPYALQLSAPGYQTLTMTFRFVQGQSGDVSKTLTLTPKG
jgi:hypothetical protein